MDINDASYNKCVLWPSAGTGTILSVPKASHLFMCLKVINRKDIHLHTILVDITYKCHFARVDLENESDIIYKSLFKRRNDKVHKIHTMWL